VGSLQKKRNGRAMGKKVSFDIGKNQYHSLEAKDEKKEELRGSLFV
jgi:hypothetical protein